MDIQNKWENAHDQNNLLTGQVTEDKGQISVRRNPGSSVKEPGIKGSE
jgi:hypothetical protein